MKFLRFHKKPLHSHKRMLLTKPNSLIGHRIGGGNIKIMSVLGVGGHGVVYLALESSFSDDANPHAYAVKALSKVGLDPQQLQVLRNELALHERVSGHAHIVTFHGVVEESDFIFLLLDYIPNGDVFDVIESRTVYAGNDELIKKVFVQLVDAVAHCHNLGVAHRDIKPENILCRDGGAHVFLTDFGLATDRTVVREYGYGSEPYMAPQCFGGFWKKLGAYSAPPLDIWSLGVVLVNLTCTCNPWHKATEDSPIFRAFLKNPDHLLHILPISHELNTILRGIFSLNPQERPSLAALRKSVLDVRRFTRDSQRITVSRPLALGSGAHTLIERQITHFGADTARLDHKARANTRTEDTETAPAAPTASSNSDEETEHPLHLPPSFSPTPTLIIAGTDSHPLQTSSPPAPQRIGVVHSSLDSDSESDDSEGPITPKTHAAPDVDIAGVPEISLAAADIALQVSDVQEKAKTRQKPIHNVPISAVRKMLCH